MAKLTAKARKHIAKKNFAIPEKAPKSGSYPIHDLAHARAALRLVAMHGTPEEKRRVRAAVYPNIPPFARKRLKS
jgi:hypothetical protein